MPKLRNPTPQETNNPAVYTKLSCHLPWIAEQYGMEYDHTGIIGGDLR